MDVSVVIPMYNAAATIREQLEALAKQDFQGSWEVLVVDNGSVDDGPKVVRSTTLSVPCTVLLAPERQGPPYARNVGARHARGQYLAFADADDVATPGWLRGLMECAVPDAICMGVLDPTLLNSKEIQKARGARPNIGTPRGPLDLMLSAWGSNMLISHDLFNELGGFDPDLLCGDDADLSYRAQLVGKEIRFAPDAVMNYRYRDNLRSLYLQVREWATWDVWFFKRYREYGTRRRPLTKALLGWWWQVSRIPLLLFPGRRVDWWIALAQRVGNIRGSIRFHTLYI